jgi:hypothetical protein
VIARWALAGGLIALSASPAFAHVTVPGVPGLIFAFIHTITELPAPLTLIGLGLLAGLNGTRALEWTWLACFPAMVIGIWTTATWGIAVDPEKPLLLVAAATGLLAASGLRLTRPVAVGVALIAGYLLGIFSWPGPASWSTTLYMASGALLGANLSFVYLSIIVGAIVQRWSHTWVLIGFRVMASWVAAISILLLALSARR